MRPTHAERLEAELGECIRTAHRPGKRQEGRADVAHYAYSSQEPRSQVKFETDPAAAATSSANCKISWMDRVRVCS